MAGSSFGNMLKITTWGESHGRGIGVVADGVPAGLEICEEEIQVFMDRRKPGQSRFTTQRKEADLVHIMSGVFEGRTTGTPISMVIYNEDQRSRDYSQIMNTYRPGHADYCYDAKYGFRDYRGGGRSSARETAARVAAGAIAVKILKELGIDIYAFTRAIGPVSVEDESLCREEIMRNSLYMPDSAAAAEASAWLDKCMANQDSAGGIVECRALGLPAGLGQPVFEKLDALLGQALFSIGAVKGVEIGAGFGAAKALGSENNDPFLPGFSKATNNAGGVLGGLSDGSPLIVRTAIKPTPSISREQITVNNKGEEEKLSIKGRHDPVVVPRAVVVVESMCALTLADLLLQNMGSRMDYMKKIYLQG